MKSDIRTHLHDVCFQALFAARGDMNSSLPRLIGLVTTVRPGQAVALGTAPAREESTREAMSCDGRYMADRLRAHVSLRTVHDRVMAALGSRGCPAEWNALKV